MMKSYMQTFYNEKNRKNKKTPELAFVSNAAKKTLKIYMTTKPFMQTISLKIIS